MNTPTTHPKNLILGLVKGYTFDKVKPFLISLKKTGFQGDVCFFVADLTPETISAIQEYGVKLQSFKEWYLKIPLLKQGKLIWKKFYFYNRLVNFYPFNRLNSWLVKTLTSLQPNPYVAKSNLVSKFVDIMGLRYPLYYLYLLEHGKNYSNVMITDVRDVLFQRDPFDFEIGDHLCCFFEEEGKTLRTGDANAVWLRDGFGAHVLDAIGDKKISCAGITIGSRSAMMEYLEGMIDNLIELKCHTWGIDQGVHNYILHSGKIKNVKFYENYHGPVLTMHFSKDEKLRFDDRGYLLNEDGSVINILHQYDRKSAEIKNKMLVYRESECTY